MHTPDMSPSTARMHEQAGTAAQADLRPQAGDTELTGEEQAALAVHHRRISETSYLPAQADYLHVR